MVSNFSSDVTSLFSNVPCCLYLRMTLYRRGLLKVTSAFFKQVHTLNILYNYSETSIFEVIFIVCDFRLY